MAELRGDQSGRSQPDEILLVIDAMTGQDAVNVAKSFDETLGIDGVDLDQTRRRHPRRRGAFGPRGDRQAHQICRVPAKSWRTWSRFIPDRMASRILGMGDVLTLIEKAQDRSLMRNRRRKRHSS